MKDCKISKSDDEKIDIKGIVFDLLFYIFLTVITVFIVWNNSEAEEDMEILRTSSEENRLIFWSLLFTGVFVLSEYIDFKKKSKIIIKKPRKNN